MYCLCACASGNRPQELHIHSGSMEVIWCKLYDELPLIKYTYFTLNNATQCNEMNCSVCKRKLNEQFTYNTYVPRIVHWKIVCLVPNTFIATGIVRSVLWQRISFENLHERALCTIPFVAVSYCHTNVKRIQYISPTHIDWVEFVLWSILSCVSIVLLLDDDISTAPSSVAPGSENWKSCVQCVNRKCTHPGYKRR